jgi:serralysin
MSTGQDSDLGIEVTVSGTVDTSTVGTYTLTYTATDASGNVGTATKTVNVVDTTAPVFTSSATFSVAENQTEIGAVTASDLSSNLAFSVSGNELQITNDGVLSFVSLLTMKLKQLILQLFQLTTDLTYRLKI